MGFPRISLIAAQPGLAADRLPRRVPSSLALASRLLGVYTCRQSYPASQRQGFSVMSCLRRSLARHVGG